MSYKYREAETKEKDAVHPIWRGIGCLLIVIFPIISFAGSIELYKAGIPQQYFPLTRDLANFTVIFGENIPLYYILIITALITFLSYVFLTVIYGIAFSIGRGGARYGPLDAPPIKRKVKKSR